MIRAAVLVSGDGGKLQTILDSMYFGEIPNFELTAVICTEPDAYALRRAGNSGVQAFVVEPSLFPTKLSYSMAISNKLKDTLSYLPASICRWASYQRSSANA